MIRASTLRLKVRHPRCLTTKALVASVHVATIVAFVHFNYWGLVRAGCVSWRESASMNRVGHGGTPVKKGMKEWNSQAMKIWT